MSLTPIAARYDHLLLDLDGCLWIGDGAIDGAPEAVAALRGAGKGIAFFSNDVRHGPEEFVRKLWRLGFQASMDEIITVGAALQYLLASNGEHGSVFVIGTRALHAHVADAGMRIVNGTEFAERADVVIVGTHEGFDYAELRTAVQAVARGARLIGVTRDATFPMEDGPWPGTGSILAALEYAAGRTADLLVGKPEPVMYATARDRLGAGRYLAVGDRLDTDVAGARRAGIDGALVLSGVTTRAMAEAADPRPTLIADSLAALVLAPEVSARRRPRAR